MHCKLPVWWIGESNVRTGTESKFGILKEPIDFNCTDCFRTRHQDHAAMKTLYFDIDGTINDYHDVTKRRLSDGTLQKLLIRKGFERLVCVSGWTTMIRDASRNPYLRPTMEQQVETLRQVIVEAFPDKEDFHARCKLEFENDQRGRHINLAEDFYYLDDWAKEFFEKHHGPGSYAAYESTRILMCDPYSDGEDIIEFLERIPNTIRTEA